jgi:energy-coupling factor transporter ATP-binding protein EcfA2
MTMYIMLFRQGQAAFQGILTSIGSMYEDALFMSNLFAYLEIPTGAEQSRVVPALSPPRGRGNAIELKDLSFKYPGKEAWALRHVTLTLKPGEKLALVGENGAGKSTLVKMLLRLYEPTEGSITYGGVDLRDMDVEQLKVWLSGLQELLLALRRSSGSTGLRTLCTVLRTATAALVYAEAVKGTTNDVVTDTGKILYASTAHQHDGVLLEVVTFTADVRNHFVTVCETHFGDLTKSRVRLLRSSGHHLKTYTTTLRAGLQRGGCGTGLLVVSTVLN